MAQTYGSVTQFDTYCADRGYVLAVGDHKAALVRATQFIDSAYGSRFPGTKTEGRDQILQWPRKDAADIEGNTIPDDEIPYEVVAATYEAAVHELAQPGVFSPVVIAGKQKKMVEISGAVTVEYAFGDDIAADMQPVFSLIDGILASILTGSSTGKSTVKFLWRA